MKIFMNDAYIEESETRITPFSHGFMYGFGAFETIRVRNQQVLYLGQHHKRLTHACSVLSLKLPYSIEECEAIIGELLSLNAVADGFVKIVASRGNQDRTDILFLTGTKVYKKEYETGLKLCLAESRRNEHSKLVGIKSMNYAENIMEKERALRLGFDEAVFLNTNGKVAEGCVSNVFWAKAGIVHTPSIRLRHPAGNRKGTHNQPLRCSRHPYPYGRVQPGGAFGCGRGFRHQFAHGNHARPIGGRQTVRYKKI